MISNHIKSKSMFFKFESMSSGYNMIVIISIIRGWPARLRGHKGSGLWKVWTVPSPPLPSPPLPSPPLPSHPLHPSLPPSLPRSRVPCRRNGNQPNLPERMSQCSAAWRSRSENEANPPCSCESAAETVFFEVELREL